METGVTLEYYDRIFGTRSPAFWELVEALEAELTSYADRIPAALASGDPVILARLRHDHRPLAENLQLTGLMALETEMKQSLGQLTPGQRDALAFRFADLVQRIVRDLADERRKAT